jgi:hypothetical protein
MTQPAKQPAARLGNATDEATLSSVEALMQPALIDQRWDLWAEEGARLAQCGKTLTRGVREPERYSSMS